MIKKIVLITTIVLVHNFSAFSQKNESNIIKEKRAIFIVNLIEQIEGFKLSHKDFTIGVLKEDQMLNVFERISKFRSIKSRKIVLKEIDNITDIRNINALYVHENSGFDIESLLSEVRGKSILAITESLESTGNNMVNLTLFKDNIYVELDHTNLTRNGFKASSKLLQVSLSSIQRLKQLLLKESTEENKENNQLKENKTALETEIKKAYSTIENKNNIISKEKDAIDELKAKSKEQTIELKQKTITLKDFERDYLIQQNLLDLKNKEIEERNQEISIQDKFLKNQKRLIKDQQNVLKTQKTALKSKDRINLLLIIIGMLSLCFMGYIITVNKNRKRLLNKLKEKHREVARNSNALARQNKELEQFAYIASHDLQEPLHTITSFADFMYEDYADKLDEEGLDNLKYIKNGCSRMQILIKSLLDYSRIGSERQLEYISSKSLVNTIIEDFNALITETSAEISFGKMPKILAYSTELRMLFQNIISNAIKFRKPNTIPKIFIEGLRLEKNEEYSFRWHFKVKDNGIGIANEHQKKIFDIFKRLHTREDYEGTGIGLAHCKKVIMFHHGDIWVNSALGKGTTFNFTIQFNPEEYEELNSTLFKNYT